MNFALITTLTACHVLMLWPASWAVDEAKPTKEAAIKVLAAFASALEANDVEKAWKYLYISGKIKEQEKKIKEAFKKRLSKILQSDISTKGVAILAKKGKWGKLAEVVGEKEAKGLTEMVGLTPSSCFGLFATSRGGAAFYWTGKEWRLIYFNNIAHLAANSERP